MLAVNGGRKYHSTRNYSYYIPDNNNDTIYRSDDLVVSNNFSQLAALSDSFNLTVFYLIIFHLAHIILLLKIVLVIIDTLFTLTEPDQYELFVSEVIPIQCLSDSGFCH